MKITVIAAIALLIIGTPVAASAHLNGCHRWHSCPSDTGSYVCGDLGYACIYPNYPTYSGYAPMTGGTPLLPSSTFPNATAATSHQDLIDWALSHWVLILIGIALVSWLNETKKKPGQG